MPKGGGRKGKGRNTGGRISNGASSNGSSRFDPNKGSDPDAWVDTAADCSVGPNGEYLVPWEATSHLYKLHVGPCGKAEGSHPRPACMNENPLCVKGLKTIKESTQAKAAFVRSIIGSAPVEVITDSLAVMEFNKKKKEDEEAEKIKKEEAESPQSMWAAAGSWLTGGGGTKKKQQKKQEVQKPMIMGAAMVAFQEEVANFKREVMIHHHDWNANDSKGLLNLGNTCYLNSILQCLYWNPNVRRAILRVKPRMAVLERLMSVLHEKETKERNEGKGEDTSSSQAKKPVVLNSDGEEESGDEADEDGNEEDGEEEAEEAADGSKSKKGGLKKQATSTAVDEDGVVLGMNTTTPQTVEEAVAALQRIFAELECSNLRAPSTQALVSALDISPGIQQDGQEFLNLFLTLLMEAQDVEDQKTTAAAAAAKKKGAASSSIDTSLADMASVVKQEFEGHVLNTRMCLNCKKKYIRSEPFVFLTLPVANLEEALADRLGPGSTGTINGYYCEECNHVGDVTTKEDLKSLPNTLIFHYLRFDFNLRTGDRQKISTAVNFPYDLDMSKFVEGGAPKAGNDNNNMYELVSVVNHLGRQPTHGHYTCDVKEFRCHQCSSSLGGEADAVPKNLDTNPLSWYTADDTDFDPTKGKKYDHRAANANSKDAYMLFYRRKENKGCSPETGDEIAHLERQWSASQQRLLSELEEEREAKKKKAELEATAALQTEVKVEEADETPAPAHPGKKGKGGGRNSTTAKKQEEKTFEEKNPLPFSAENPVPFTYRFTLLANREHSSNSVVTSSGRDSAATAGGGGRKSSKSPARKKSPARRSTNKNGSSGSGAGDGEPAEDYLHVLQRVMEANHQRSKDHYSYAEQKATLDKARTQWSSTAEDIFSPHFGVSKDSKVDHTGDKSAYAIPTAWLQFFGSGALVHPGLVVMEDKVTNFLDKFQTTCLMTSGSDNVSDAVNIAEAERRVQGAKIALSQLPAICNLGLRCEHGYLNPESDFKVISHDNWQQLVKTYGCADQSFPLNAADGQGGSEVFCPKCSHVWLNRKQRHRQAVLADRGERQQADVDVTSDGLYVNPKILDLWRRSKGLLPNEVPLPETETSSEKNNSVKHYDLAEGLVCMHHELKPSVPKVALHPQVVIYLTSSDHSRFVMSSEFPQGREPCSKCAHADSANTAKLHVDHQHRVRESAQFKSELIFAPDRRNQKVFGRSLNKETNLHRKKWEKEQAILKKAREEEEALAKEKEEEERRAKASSVKFIKKGGKQAPEPKKAAATAATAAVESDEDEEDEKEKKNKKPSPPARTKEFFCLDSAWLQEWCEWTRQPKEKEAIAPQGPIPNRGHLCPHGGCLFVVDDLHYAALSKEDRVKGPRLVAIENSETYDAFVELYPTDAVIKIREIDEERVLDPAPCQDCLQAQSVARELEATEYMGTGVINFEGRVQTGKKTHQEVSGFQLEGLSHTMTLQEVLNQCTADLIKNYILKNYKRVIEISDWYHFKNPSDNNTKTGSPTEPGVPKTRSKQAKDAGREKVKLHPDTFLLSLGSMNIRSGDTVGFETEGVSLLINPDTVPRGSSKQENDDIAKAIAASAEEAAVAEATAAPETKKKGAAGGKKKKEEGFVGSKLTGGGKVADHKDEPQAAAATKECGVCTFHNAGLRTLCEMCESPLP